MQNAAARGAFAIVAILFVVTALALAKRGVLERQSFKAFYCAGAAVLERRDPYRVEPLRTCEHRVSPVPLPAGHVEPAPLPGYAMVPFALLATLPPKTAAYAFALALAVATLLSALCLAAVLRASPTAVLIAFMPLTLLNVTYGEIPPLAVLGVCMAAYFLRKGSWTAAGTAVMLAMLQPQVGVPAVLAVFLFAPRSRGAILISSLALVAISFAALGVSQNIEYFTAVLPLQARAELVAADQYSLARVLYMLGSPANVSLMLAQIEYALMAAIGLCIAGIAASRFKSPEIIPLLPPAAVLLGGVFVHDIQMLFALPAALLVASRARGRVYGTMGAIALALLVAVWTQRAGRAAIALDTAGVVAGVLAITQGPLSRRLVQGLGTAVAVIACMMLLQRVAPPLESGQIVTAPFTASASELAPDAWGRYLRSTPALTRPEPVSKLPTWLALVLLMVCSLQGILAREATGGDEMMPRLARSGPHEPPLASAS
jgi:Glycosyltransferase family 87